MSGAVLLGHPYAFMAWAMALTGSQKMSKLTTYHMKCLCDLMSGAQAVRGPGFDFRPLLASGN